jgi:hypothetical protein
VIAATLAAAAAWAVEPFTVRDIRVEGLQRVEPGTIFASLPLRVGDTYSDETGSAAIRALFELGLFKDVRLDVNNGVLVVIVEERPTVADVDFVGTKEFDKTALQKSLREVGLADGRPCDKALTDRAEQMAETTRAFTDYFGTFGYAFARVEARPEIDRATNRVTRHRQRHRGRPHAALPVPDRHVVLTAMAVAPPRRDADARRRSVTPIHPPAPHPPRTSLDPQFPLAPAGTPDRPDRPRHPRCVRDRQHRSAAIREPSAASGRDARPAARRDPTLAR